MFHGVVDSCFGYHLFEWNLGAHAYFLGLFERNEATM
jgi:hypothetical protein